MNAKAQIKKRISEYPGNADDNEMIDWLDDINNRICNSLTDILKREDRFDRIRTEVLLYLGDNSSHLPQSAIDSLTTAEMLFNSYANAEFANQGFDFSCISALYYQSFEDAYNDLIWKEYSDTLNSLMIENVSYISILDSNRYNSITQQIAKGYLFDNDSRQRSFYIDYGNPRYNTVTRVKPSCMYKSFAILLEEIKSNSDSYKFCDFFAEITSFDNKEAMFNDSSFISCCQSFIQAVKNSAENRNNASHGGSHISMEQCQEDKKTVLSDLESIRNNSLGLIQQLLYLLYR